MVAKQKAGGQLETSGGRIMVEILGRMTPAGRRMMSISIAVLDLCTIQRGDGLCHPRIHPFDPGWTVDLAPLLGGVVCLLLVKGASGIVADATEALRGFRPCVEIRIAVVRLKSPLPSASTRGAPRRDRRYCSGATLTTWRWWWTPLDEDGSRFHRCGDSASWLRSSSIGT